MSGQPTWPDWETVGTIGSGASGTVYEIQRETFGNVEKAALKVISIPQSSSEIESLRDDGYDDESITSRYRSNLEDIVREYSLMSGLKGVSNIVDCDDVHYIPHEDGFGWDVLIKMELLTPITKALGSEVEEKTVIQIGIDICRALVLCKEMGIVHRDIKPQNVFVSSHGNYKLGDFGVAKVIESTTMGTKTGTYRYMAPEVYNNLPYGAAADVYSLGLLMYWMLNKKRTPFLPMPPQTPTARQEEQALVMRCRGDRIAPPCNGSDRLKDIVMKACEYDPNNRYLSAKAMMEDLEALRNEKRQAEKPAEEEKDQEGRHPEQEGGDVAKAQEALHSGELDEEIEDTVGILSVRGRSREHDMDLEPVPDLEPVVIPGPEQKNDTDKPKIVDGATGRSKSIKIENRNKTNGTKQTRRFVWSPQLIVIIIIVVAIAFLNALSSNTPRVNNGKLEPGDNVMVKAIAGSAALWPVPEDNGDMKMLVSTSDTITIIRALGEDQFDWYEVVVNHNSQEISGYMRGYKLVEANNQSDS